MLLIFDSTIDNSTILSKYTTIYIEYFTTLCKAKEKEANKKFQPKLMPELSLKVLALSLPPTSPLEAKFLTGSGRGKGSRRRRGGQQVTVSVGHCNRNCNWEKKLKSNSWQMMREFFIWILWLERHLSPPPTPSPPLPLLLLLHDAGHGLRNPRLSQG